MPDRSGPPTLSLALGSVLQAAMGPGARPALLSIVRPRDSGPDDGAGADRIVVPFPLPRRPDGPDDGPYAA